MTLNEIVKYVLNIQRSVNRLGFQYAQFTADAYLNRVALTIGDIIHGQKQVPHKTIVYYEENGMLTYTAIPHS